MEEQDISYEKIQEETLRRQSLSGENGRKEKDRKIRMNYRDYIRTLKALTCATALATTLIIGGGHVVYKHLKETAILNNLSMEFQMECINKETHRTQDFQHYYYDYEDIARYIEELDDFDIGIYLFNRQTNDEQTNRVLKYTKYGSMENYLSSNNWENSDEFRREIRLETLLTVEKDKKEEELERRKESRQNTSFKDEENETGERKK